MLVTGCSKPLESQVSGLVTLDGKAMDKGNVVFHPVQAGAPAYGTIDPTGHYSVKTGQGKGIQPGEYIVVVTANEEVVIPTDPSVPDRPPALLSPRKYATKQTSTLHFTVTPGEQTIDLPLETE